MKIKQIIHALRPVHGLKARAYISNKSFLPILLLYKVYIHTYVSAYVPTYMHAYI